MSETKPCFEGENKTKQKSPVKKTFIRTLWSVMRLVLIRFESSGIVREVCVTWLDLHRNGSQSQSSGPGMDKKRPPAFRTTLVRSIRHGRQMVLANGTDLLVIMGRVFYAPIWLAAGCSDGVLRPLLAEMLFWWLIWNAFCITRHRWAVREIFPQVEGCDSQWVIRQGGLGMLNWFCSQKILYRGWSASWAVGESQRDQKAS